MRIRKADAREMLALWGYEDVQTAPPTARFFYQNLTSGNAVFWTIEAKDGLLLGELYVFLEIQEDREFADGTATAYLCAFRIRKEYRGQGYGTRMMEAALSDLKAKGFRRATIGVDEERNLRLYRKMGFVTEVKVCRMDPCDRDEEMKPVNCDRVFHLLVLDLTEKCFEKPRTGF